MWQTDQNQLYKKFTFDDFKQAFEFVTQVAKLAEEQQHHPRWTNEWNVVELWLSTHDSEDNITEKDRKLAGSIDKLIQDMGADTK